MFTAVSLFTGCGGSDRGLIDAGCQILLANDISAYAKDVYEANLPQTEYLVTDIATVRTFPRADVLIGCYPCQGYSQGGSRNADLEVNQLYRQFDRALRIMRPKAFIVENVPGMTRGRNRRFLANQLTRFRFAGYRVNWNLLNGIDYGLAQERRRIFIVGIRSKLGVRFQFPDPTHGPNLKPYVSQEDCLPKTHSWPQGEFYDKGFHWYYLSRNRYRSWGFPSKTILANARHMPLHPMSPSLIKVGPDRWVFDGRQEDARRLSFKEGAVLQGLHGWTFPENAGLMMKYRVIGNAVPPTLFEQIANALPEEVKNA